LGIYDILNGVQYEQFLEEDMRKKEKERRKTNLNKKIDY
jgi:hypothetical protein